MKTPPNVIRGVMLAAHCVYDYHDYDGKPITKAILGFAEVSLSNKTHMKILEHEFQEKAGAVRKLLKR